jgi:hypothetical protein
VYVYVHTHVCVLVYVHVLACVLVEFLGGSCWA